MVYQACVTGAARAMRAAIEMICALHSVTEYPDAAALTGWRQRMNCALEGVIGMSTAVAGHRDRAGVVVSTGFAAGHDVLLLLMPYTARGEAALIPEVAFKSSPGTGFPLAVSL